MKPAVLTKVDRCIVKCGECGTFYATNEHEDDIPHACAKCGTPSLQVVRRTPTEGTPSWQ